MTEPRPPVLNADRLQPPRPLPVDLHLEGHELLGLERGAHGPRPVVEDALPHHLLIGQQGSAGLVRHELHLVLQRETGLESKNLDWKYSLAYHNNAYTANYKNQSEPRWPDCPSQSWLVISTHKNFLQFTSLCDIHLYICSLLEF